MTDFVGRVLRPERDDWIIRSLMDVDFYKFTMAYFIHELYPDVLVKFKLINRNRRIPIGCIIDECELRRQLEHVRTLRFRRTDIYYLRGMDIYGDRMFSENFLKFLGELRMVDFVLEREDDQYYLAFEGPWPVVTFWETIAMAIVCELLYRKLMSTMTAGNLESLYNTAKTNLEQKMLQLKSRPGIRFADFGQRRRHSFLWQQYAIRRAREIMGDRFTGTSNTWMAFNQDMVPIGTNAHELPMVLTAIAPDSVKKYPQYRVLQEWGKMFPHHALRIVLPDTYGSAQFWRDMPNDLGKEVAETWRGIRADSGDCIVEALNYAQWLKSQGLSNERILKEKIVIPSDGLDVTAKERCGSMIEIDKVLDGVIDHPFGWGTNLSNGFAGCHPRPDDRAVVNDVPLDLSNGDLFRGQSLVIKVDSANGNAAVKLSNNINKATGDLKDVEKYIKIFGSEGQVSQEVSV